MRAIKILLAILFSIAVVACGGGGGGGTPAASTIISGTAAAGAPVVGYVSVRDSSANPQPVRTNIPIAANGNYSVDVVGLTAPYAFLASGTVGGRTVSLYSAATAADVGGTINITPFTDLIIRNIAATAVDTYLSNPANMANLTTAQLDAQRVALTAQLAPALTAMGVSSSIDLLRATFNADSTGLDRFMDAVKVDTTTPTAVTITNILDAANTLVINTTASATTLAATGTLSTTNLATSSVGTPLDAMLAGTKAFSALFATSLPSPTDPALLALFSSTFMDGGQDLSAFLTEITTDSTMIGLKFANLVVDSVDTVAGTAQVHFTPVNAAGVNIADGGAISWQMKKNATTGAWQMDGDRRIAHVRVTTVAEKITCNPANTACTMTTTYGTGLHLEINNKAMQPVGSAVVTGSGLPVGGVTLVMQANQTWFSITTTNPNCGANGCNNNWYMADSEIAAVLPNSSYTVKLYSNAATPVLLATYTEVVPVAPVLNTAKVALAYPSLTGMVNLNGISAVTLTPSWSIPSGLSASYLEAYVWQNVTNANMDVEKNDMTSSSGTASLVITAPPSGGTWSGGGYSISARDQYGGKVVTRYFQ